MRLVVLLALALSTGCDGQEGDRRGSAAQRAAHPSSQAPQPAPAPQPSHAAPASRPAFPIRIAGTGFVDSAGAPFAWRGVTAFRLAEMIAHGREQDAVRYLDWAASQHLTVVRVLMMAQHLFKLSPEEGRAALPRLLQLAKARGIAVEVVALADTRDVTFDYGVHLRDLGRIATENGNAFIEIANEPGHPTQDDRVHTADFLQQLARTLPGELPVALGSIEYGDAFAAADYITTHVPRGQAGWDHVLEIAGRAELVRRFDKPVVSDEPIGAGPEYQPGRRDNDPQRFAAAAALTRLAGLHATFHYESGLQAKVPDPREAACLEAWRQGLDAVKDVSTAAEFVSGSDLSRIAKVERARAAFARVSATRAVLLLVDPAADAKVEWSAGWSETARGGPAGVLVIVAER